MSQWVDSARGFSSPEHTEFLKRLKMIQARTGLCVSVVFSLPRIDGLRSMRVQIDDVPDYQHETVKSMEQAWSVVLDACANRCDEMIDSYKSARREVVRILKKER